MDYFDDIGEFPSSSNDDIRLCIMHRTIPTQRVGIRNWYHRQEQIVHWSLDNTLKSPLAYHAGIKDNDVLIVLNGISLENYTLDGYYARFDSTRDLPVEVLVCDWPTYLNYKNRKQTIHCNLPTVQHLKPVFATTSKCLRFYFFIQIISSFCSNGFAYK